MTHRFRTLMAIPATLIILAALNARTQTPTFEVTSVKLTAPNSAGNTQASVLLFLPAGFRKTNTTLKSLIQTAYRLQDFQLAEGPNWIDSDRYDVEGKTEANAQPGRNQVLSMVQALLADRFKLKAHQEMREGQVYGLIVGSNGIKMRQSTDPTSGLPGLRGGANGRLIAKASMPQLVDRLSGILRRPVLDQTKLAGLYEFTLEWLPDESQFLGDGPVPAPANPSAPSLFTAVQEQLGLRLDSQKAPIEVLVIDSAEKPSPN